MIMARRKLPGSQSTLERRYDFHLGEAFRASLAGSLDKAETHSGAALTISRELYRNTSRHRPGLAAALACHAGSSAAYGRIGEAVALLTESAGHYAALAHEDPGAYEVARIDVLTQVAIASDTSGNTRDAIALLREVIRMYAKAPAAAAAERDFGLARARFHLGRCLFKAGARHAALVQIDLGLAGAERAWASLGVPADSGSGAWLATAPRFVQRAAPDWCGAAARSMTMHAAADRWADAGKAARVALRLSAGLAVLGGDEQRDVHAAIRERAAEIEIRTQARGSSAPPAGDDGLCHLSHRGSGGRPPG
jgi:hypothetical protein